MEWFACMMIVGTALGARLFVAVAHFDLMHPDEHFQTLEPAALLVYGLGWKTWEWTIGTRSWLIPATYVPSMAAVKFLGASDGGSAPILASRALMAVMNAWVVARFATVLRKRGLSAPVRVGACSWLALSPGMLAWAPTTLSDNWALITLWLGLPVVLDALDSSDRSRWFSAGIACGLPVLARIQMALWVIGTAAVLGVRAVRNGRSRLLVAWALGVMLPFAAGGLLDWPTWGAPFHSVIQNVRMNLFQDVASQYGVAPWHAYSSMMVSELGFGTVLVLLALPVSALLRGGGSTLDARDALILIPAVVLLAGHSCIPHKEFRFILPLVPALFYWAAWAASWQLPTAVVSRPKALIGAIAAIGLVAAPLAVSSALSADRYPSSNMTDVMIRIRERGLGDADPCVLLVGHYWVWSHGELLQGRHYTCLEERPDQLSPATSDACAYAVVLPQFREAFLARVSPTWRLVMKGRNGYLLFANR
jgi:GPI mannosyltransferase 3